MPRRKGDGAGHGGLNYVLKKGHGVMCHSGDAAEPHQSSKEDVEMQLDIMKSNLAILEKILQKKKETDDEDKRRKYS